MKVVVNKFLKVKNLFATAFLVMGILYITRIITPTYVETSVLYFAFAWFLYSTRSLDFKIKRQNWRVGKLEILWYVASILGGGALGHLIGYYYIKIITGVNPLLETDNVSQPEILKELEGED